MHNYYYHLHPVITKSLIPFYNTTEGKEIADKIFENQVFSLGWSPSLAKSLPRVYGGDRGYGRRQRHPQLSHQDVHSGLGIQLRDASASCLFLQRPLLRSDCEGRQLQYASPSSVPPP